MAPPASNPIPGPEIRAWRKAAGLTQTALGAIIGVSHVTISSWERGRYAISQQSKDRLHAIGCPHQEPDLERLQNLVDHPPIWPTDHQPVQADAPRPHTTPKTGCPDCPAAALCRELCRRDLWCLCEQEPPLAADVKRVAIQDPDLQPPPLPYAFQGG